MPKLYRALAPWWPLMSAPADYAEEAAFYQRTLEAASDGPLRTVLELGSGGGNNASHLKARFDMVLVEPSPGLLAVSRALNRACCTRQVSGCGRSRCSIRKWSRAPTKSSWPPSRSGSHPDASRQRMELGSPHWLSSNADS